MFNPLKELDGLYFIDFEDLEETLKQKPKAFILCHPHNPVGKVWTREELKRMGELCLRYQVPVISDEIHGDLMLWNHQHIPMATISPDIAQNTITCFSIGKTFNLAGVQASTVAFYDGKQREAFNQFWSRLHLERPNSFAQSMVTAAYNCGNQWLDELIRYLEGNATYVHQYLTELIPSIKATIPQAAFLMWLDCRALGLNNEELQQFLVYDAKLGLNPGNSFDRQLTGYARLNFACPRMVLEKVMKQLEAAVNKLLVSKK